MKIDGEASNSRGLSTFFTQMSNSRGMYRRIFFKTLTHEEEKKFNLLKNQ